MDNNFIIYVLHVPLYGVHDVRPPPPVDDEDDRVRDKVINTVVDVSLVKLDGEFLFKQTCARDYTFVSTIRRVRLKNDFSALCACVCVGWYRIIRLTFVSAMACIQIHRNKKILKKKCDYSVT